MAGAGFAGMNVEVDGGSLALDVACVGGGTLIVTFGRDGISLPTTGGDAVAFPCSDDAEATMRHEWTRPLPPGP